MSANGAPKGNIGRAQAYWVTADTIAWNPGAVSVKLGRHAALRRRRRPDPRSRRRHRRHRDPADLRPGRPLRRRQGEVPAHRGYQRLPRPGEPPGRGARGPQGADRRSTPRTAAAPWWTPPASRSRACSTTSTPTTGRSAPRSPPAKSRPCASGRPRRASVKLHLFADSNPATPATVSRHDRRPGDRRLERHRQRELVRPVLRSTRWTSSSAPPGRSRPTWSPIPTRSACRATASAARSSTSPTSAYKPAGWDTCTKPRLDAPEDIVLYELHVRDFSVNDPSVPANLKGTFKAFTLPFSNGMRHLRTLSLAGLTHVHLLPVFDIATDRRGQVASGSSPAGNLSSFPPDSEEQQAARARPWPTPTASTGATTPGTTPCPRAATPPTRTARRASSSSARWSRRSTTVGLRVVMDVVYNHTNAAGQNDRSVLDRIVPGYYHRLNSDGNIETSTCCQNTASEFNMMEKLLIDSVVTWAKQYKVDGFRFDLMGHHMKRNILKLRAALDALTVANAGVDGTKIYLYGEGWNFGEVANNARGVNATQANMAGTGIGTFSDRLRDGVRGGGPFSRHPGAGLPDRPLLRPERHQPGLRRRPAQPGCSRRPTGCAPAWPAPRDLPARGPQRQPRGSPPDRLQRPAGRATPPTRRRSSATSRPTTTTPCGTPSSSRPRPRTPSPTGCACRTWAMSLLGFGQGIPFYHAGVELLRSKSLDRNSYNSGDWFNKLDFTYGSNNWGVGLPPAAGQPGQLADHAAAPGQPGAQAVGRPDILKAYAHFLETLAIRKSTPLFRLRTGDAVQSNGALPQHRPEPAPRPHRHERRGRGRRRRPRPRAAWWSSSTPTTRRRPSPSPSFRASPCRSTPSRPSPSTPWSAPSSFNRTSGAFSVPGRTAAVFWS